MLDNLFQSLNLLESRWEHVEANWARSAGWIAISTTRSRPTTFLLLASGRHLIDTKSEASAQPLPMHPALEDGLLEWRSQGLYNQPEDYVLASERPKGRKPLDLSSRLKKRIQPAFERIGIAVWAGIPSGIWWERCWRRWANTSSPSGTTCGIATCTSPTSTCRRRRASSAQRRTNSSMRSCPRAGCPRQS